MTQRPTSPSRGALIARRTLLLAAVLALIGSIVSTSADSSVARAEGATPPAQTRPAVATAPPPEIARGGGRRPTGVLNLNTATASELELLPGIGPTKAERVLDFRTKHGPFKRVFDLRRVKGFGKKTVDRLAPLLTLTEKTSLHAE
jgi:competence protein ComEA